MKNKVLKNEIKWIMFLLPCIVPLLILVYYPSLQCIFKSFFIIKDVTSQSLFRFSGFKNYAYVLNSPGFLNALYVTFVLMLLSLVYIPVGFILADLINKIKSGPLQAMYRILFFFPYVLPGVAVIMIFQVFLQADGGVLNSILTNMTGIDIKIGWLSNPNLARVGVSIISNYSSLPYGMIICLAGLQAIPVEYYEAAEMDGANTVQKLRYITLPRMRGIFTFLIITQVIFGFQRINDLLIVAGGIPTGAPAGSLQSIMMLIYEWGFYSGGSGAVIPNYGIVYAASTVLLVIICVVTVLNNKLLNSKGDE